MTKSRHLLRDETGVTVIETAFALPVLIVMIWMLIQLGIVYSALAGIQQGLGEGARYATLCINPALSGCSAPTADQIKTRISEKVYSTNRGTFTVPIPTPGTAGNSKYFDLTVTYTQPTDLLLFPGPTINISRRKRVWIAG
jgi:Flp pilus assembly protein TadG